VPNIKDEIHKRLYFNRALDLDLYDTILYQQDSTAHERSFAMAEINWERKFSKAIELAGKTHKPIYQDFWFEG
jgi:hypothetical protein